MNGLEPPWLLVEPGQLADRQVVRLGPEESRHLVASLRRRAGDRVTLADGCGTVADGVVERAASGGAEVLVQAVRTEPEPSGPGLTLALAVLSGQAMDWAVQKAVEVGVRRLVPVVTERTQQRLPAARRRLEHWRRVARAALKQCHRAWAMEMADPSALSEVAQVGRVRGGVLADPGGSTLAELPATCGSLLLVGPEGGLSQAEAQLLDGAGWWRLRLGPHTLRAETAAVVGSALLVNR